MKRRLAALTLVILFVMLLPSCKKSEKPIESNNGPNSAAKNESNIDFSSANNQNTMNWSSLRLFAADNEVLYLSNDGYYMLNNDKTSNKIFDYNINYCLKKDGWIYAKTDFGLENLAGVMEDGQYNYLLRFSLDGTKVEKIIDQDVYDAYYSKEYIFFSEIDSDGLLSIYRCDYSGGSIKKLFIAGIACWMVTEDAVIYVESGNSDFDMVRMMKVDHEGRNPQVIANISKVTKDMSEGSRIVNILTKGNELYYRQIFFDEYEGDPAKVYTRLYKVSNASSNEPVITNQGIYRYVFLQNAVIANNICNIKSYKYDGSGETLIYSSPNDEALSSVYSVNGKLYFCLDKDFNGVIMQYSIDSGESKEIIKGLQIDGMLGNFLGDGYIE